MSLRNLLGLGRRLLRKKGEDVTPDPLETTTIGGLPDISKLKTTTPKTIAEQSKELVIREPKIGGVLQTRPMQMGATKADNLFGSVAYDRVAQKGGGSFTADEWADWLTDRGKRKFKLFGKDFEDGFVTGKRFKLDEKFARGSNLYNKEQTVPIEELFDSNVATFDRAGELTGGLLFAAKQANIKLPGQVLADMIKLNPANRLKFVEYGLPGDIANKADNVITQQLYRVKSMERSLDKNVFDRIRTSDPSADRLQKIEGYREAVKFSKDMKATLKDLRNEMRAVRTSVLDSDKFGAEDAAAKSASLIGQLKKGATTEQKVALNQMQGEIDDLVASLKNVKGTKYQSQAGYTFPGGQNYREGVLVLDERIPLNMNKGRKKNPHYDDKEASNPIAHVRYDTRTTSDGKKAFFIHEIQSDTNQKISKSLREAGEDPFNTVRRTNPYQNDVVINFLSQSRKKLSDDILSGKLRPAEIELSANKIKSIDNQLKTITKKATEYEQINKENYFPLLDRSSYASAAVKLLTNKAAKEGIDYVAIAPTNLLQRGMDKEKVSAYTQFYGYSSGKKTPGSKSFAVIPDIMKKIAKEFDTQAGPIKVSKSDPTKPYKSVTEKNVEVSGDKKYKVEEHARVSSRMEEGLEFIPDNNLRLYTDVFSVKVSPNMVNPQKIYKKEGGFISKYN